jgi:ubiquinone/menaquinone biosynthesis C-methylase UbiE
MTEKSDMSLARFEKEYEGKPAWDIGEPQPFFAELFANEVPAGPVLDVGCGSGDLALYVASLGCATTGIDFVESAIDEAREKAAVADSDAQFICHDAFKLSVLECSFNTVLDCCFFHMLDSAEARQAYLEQLRQVMPAGATLWLLNFAIELPTPNAPIAVTESLIRETFTQGWTVQSLQTTKVAVTFFEEGIPALGVEIQRDLID